MNYATDQKLQILNDFWTKNVCRCPLDGAVLETNITRCPMKGEGYVLEIRCPTCASTFQTTRQTDPAGPWTAWSEGQAIVMAKAESPCPACDSHRVMFTRVPFPLEHKEQVGMVCDRCGNQAQITLPAFLDSKLVAA